MRGIELERRMIVKGWKVEARPGGYRPERHEFSSVHHFADERSIAAERARIGEDLPAWHPHITEVIVQERYVTPWEEVEA